MDTMFITPFMATPQSNKHPHDEGAHRPAGRWPRSLQLNGGSPKSEQLHKGESRPQRGATCPIESIAKENP